MSTFLTLSRDSFYSLVFHLAPRFASTVLFVTVGRLGGPTDAGILSLAVTYLVMSVTFTRGLDDLVIRQVSREPDRAGSYLTSFLALRAVLSLVVYGLLALVVYTLFDYNHRTSTTILLMGLSLVPDSLAYVAQSIFLGLRRFREPAVILASTNMLKAILGILALLCDYELEQVIWLWPIGSTVAATLMVAGAVKQARRVQASDWINWKPLERHWRAGLSFLFITTMGALETQTDTVILSGYHHDTEVGWYGAATTITYAMIMFSQAYRFGVYPLMARYALQSPEKLSQLYKDSVRYLGTFILPAACGIALLSPQTVRLVFGLGFEPSIGVLRILVLVIIVMFLNEPNVRVLLAHDRQNLVSLFLVVSVTGNVALNLALTPSHGALGAAAARVSSASIFFVLNLLCVVFDLDYLPGVRWLFKALAATAIMALPVYALRNWSLLGAILLGVLVYVTALCLVGGVSSREAAMVRTFVTYWRT